MGKVSDTLPLKILWRKRTRLTAALFCAWDEWVEGQVGLAAGLTGQHGLARPRGFEQFNSSRPVSVTGRVSGGHLDVVLVFQPLFALTPSGRLVIVPTTTKGADVGWDKPVSLEKLGVSATKTKSQRLWVGIGPSSGAESGGHETPVPHGLERHPPAFEVSVSSTGSLSAFAVVAAFDVDAAGGPVKPVDSFLPDCVNLMACDRMRGRIDALSNKVDEAITGLRNEFSSAPPSDVQDRGWVGLQHLRALRRVFRDRSRPPDSTFRDLEAICADGVEDLNVSAQHPLRAALEVLRASLDKDRVGWDKVVEVAFTCVAELANASVGKRRPVAKAKPTSGKAVDLLTVKTVDFAPPEKEQKYVPVVVTLVKGWVGDKVTLCLSSGQQPLANDDYIASGLKKSDVIPLASGWDDRVAAESISKDQASWSWSRATLDAKALGQSRKVIRFYVPWAMAQRLRLPWKENAVKSILVVDG